MFIWSDDLYELVIRQLIRSYEMTFSQLEYNVKNVDIVVLTGICMHC